MHATLLTRSPLAAPARRAGRKSAVAPVAAAAVPTEFKKVAPLGDRVFVKVDAAEATSAGGILLPSAAQEKATAGVVTARGGKAAGLADGDRVVYSQYAGTEVKMGSDAYVLLKEEDVLGKQPGADPGAMTPLGDRVLLRAVEAKRETDGGVILASDSDVERPTLGEVIAVGPGKTDDEGNTTPVGVAKGNVVLYSKYAGTEFKAPDGTEYVVVRAADVLATVA